MELYQLHYFLYVAKYENITKAAQELRVGQPAVSKAIKSLEKDFQVQLLKRNGKRVYLTHEGQLLKTRLIPLLRGLDALPAELQIFGERREVIKLNVLSCNLLLADIIKKFKELEPNVVFMITEQREKTDWNLCIRSTSPEIGYTNGIRLMEERICLASKKGTWLDARESVVFEDLKKEEFIMLRQGAQIRNIAEAKFHEAGFVPHVGFECDTLYMVQRMTEEGLGVALWPEHSWGKSDKVKLTQMEGDMRRTIYLLEQPERTSSQGVLHFSAFLQEYIRNVKQI